MCFLSEPSLLRQGSSSNDQGSCMSIEYPVTHGQPEAVCWPDSVWTDKTLQQCKTLLKTSGKNIMDAPTLKTLASDRLHHNQTKRHP